MSSQSYNDDQAVRAAKRRLYHDELVADCRKNYGEAHDAHMALNGECPWCGATGASDPTLDSLTSEQAVAEVVRRHG